MRHGTARRHEGDSEKRSRSSTNGEAGIARTADWAGAASRLGLNLAITALLFLGPAMLVLLTDWGQQETAKAEPVRQPLAVAGRANMGPSPTLTPADRAIFLRLSKSRLPRYLDHFQREGRRHGIDWKLLAAQAYQESHWNPRAISPTGVRGIMMLTKITSSSVGVRNRLDPVQSIQGGARHLARLLRQMPEEIGEPDRTWIALAAYNVGPGHVTDAMILARRFGKDPTRWANLKEVFPLLARKKYYRTLPHRYARGWEPVSYVGRIRAYWNFLQERYPASADSSTAQL